jgi:hypothetical protein
VFAASSLAADPGAASLKPVAATDFDRAAAAHLLRRAGFGGTSDAVDRLAELGPDAAVASLLEFGATPYDPPPPPLEDILLDDFDRADLFFMNEEERQAYRQKRQMAEREAAEEVRLWWLERMSNSPRPLEEKMTLFWHGHFTSGFREVRRAIFMKEQNEFLRRHCLGNFRELLIGVSRDRAMLVYLDNARNQKVTPNENYARELLELFTLGLGNYSEADIKAAARAFTGWGFDREGFVFREQAHDFGEKTFLGRKGDWNGEDIIDIVLDQPACARFLARTILEFFVRPDPPEPLINAFAAEVRKQKFELRPAMKTLLKSQAFYHAEARGALVKSPVELLIGTARQLGLPVTNLSVAERALAAMGQELMQPPNVKGWDGGTKWINTATLFTRYNTVGGLINGGGREDRRRRDEVAEAANDETPAEPASSGMQPMKPNRPKSRREGARQPGHDPGSLIRAQALETPEQIVEFFAAHLLAVPLSDEKRAELAGYLRDESGKFDVNQKRAAQRIRTMIHLLCSTPEYQLN